MTLWFAQVQGQAITFTFGAGMTSVSCFSLVLVSVWAFSSPRYLPSKSLARFSSSCQLVYRTKQPAAAQSKDRQDDRLAPPSRGKLWCCKGNRSLAFCCLRICIRGLSRLVSSPLEWPLVGGWSVQVGIGVVGVADSYGGICWCLADAKSLPVPSGVARPSGLAAAVSVQLDEAALLRVRLPAHRYRYQLAHLDW